jgi:hypothetical protein
MHEHDFTFYYKKQLKNNSKKVAMKTHAKMNNYKPKPWCNKQMVKCAIKSHHLMWEQIQNLKLEDRIGDCY